MRKRQGLRAASAWPVPNAAALAGCVCLMAACVPWSGPRAESVDSASAGRAPQGGPDALEQVVVTAERRPMKAQRTPISVIAMTGRTLAARGIGGIDTLQTEAPSLSYVDNGNTQFINIRGVGLDEAAPNQTNGVAVNYDGAYVAREFNNRDPFFDLRDVEVLRGPQGTYQGQNASGGAININAAPPVLNRITGFAETSYGSFNHWLYDGALNLPLAHGLAFRASFWNEARDSFWTNNGPSGHAQNSNHPGDLRREFFRAQLLYAPSRDFSLRLIEQHSVTRSDGPAFQTNAMFAGQKPYDIDYDYPGLLDTSYNRVTGIADWNATDIFRLHATLAYQTTKQVLRQDTDDTSPFVQPSVPQSTNLISLKDYYYTGELDLISSAPGPFSWTAGATFLQYDQKALVHATHYNTQANPALSSDPNAGLVIFVEAPRQNQALFADIGYKIAPQLEIRLGARYNHDLLGFSPTSYLQPLGPQSAFLVPLQPGYPQFNTFTGRVLVTYTPTRNDMVYGSISRGYKPGGTTPFADRYAPEYVLNYELGWKGNALDGRLRPSVSAFFMQYKNYQATVAVDPNNPTLNITDNVRGSTVKGVEAQLDGQVGPWGFDGAFSWLDAEYGDLTILEPAGALGGGLPAAAMPIELGGRPLDFVPKFSGTAGISYRRDVLFGKLVGSVRVNYRSFQWGYFYDLAYQKIPPRGTVDLRISYQYGAHWQVDVYGSNIFNRTTIVNVLQTTNGIGARVLGAPAEFGVKLAYVF